MNRRDFLTTAAAGASLLLGGTTGQAQAPRTAPARAKMHGCNLGGWLALEKWIAPSVYEGVDAPDEYTLCQMLGKEKATERLKKHRETWITEADFKWLAERGINSVRLPIAYGVAEENPPYITGMDTVEWAFRTAKANGIGVLLDLHGVPGSQNAWDHSGRQGTLGWHTSKENIDHSLRIVESLAQQIKGYDNLIGFEVLNEPRWDVPIDIIKSYYQEAYQRVRKHIPADHGAVVIHDAFRGNQWANFMQEPEYANVILDTHMYQCYTDDDRKRDIYGQIDYAGATRKKQLDDMKKQLPVMVAEWSCAMPPESTRGLPRFAEDTGVRAYGATQLTSFETTRGWFYWTYKLESGGGWNFRDCVKHGWMPDQYNV